MIDYLLRLLRSHAHTYATARPWARCETADCPVPRVLAGRP